MNIALLVGRLLLALVFAVAGTAKLADREGSRRAIVDFGAPSVLAAPLGLLLPLAELDVAATLLPASTAWWGALGALSLLSVFLVGISVNLARGRTPDCHCFGQLPQHRQPRWKTLARNGALAAVAGFVPLGGLLGGAGPSALAWLRAPDGPAAGVCWAGTRVSLLGRTVVVPGAPAAARTVDSWCA